MSQKKQDIESAAAPAEDASSVEEKKPKKGKRDDPALPFLVELVFQFSGFFLLLVTLSVALISFLSGAHFVEIIIRTGATIVVCGALMLMLSSKISQDVLEAAAQAEIPDDRLDSGFTGRKDVKA